MQVKQAKLDLEKAQIALDNSTVHSTVDGVVRTLIDVDSDKADNSPFPELFALRRIVSRQMCVKRFKAVGMPYDDASSIASLPSCENDRTGSGGMDRCGQFYRHIDSRMKTMFSRYG